VQAAICAVAERQADGDGKWHAVSTPLPSVSSALSGSSSSSAPSSTSSESPELPSFQLVDSESPNSAAFSQASASASAHRKLCTEGMLANRVTSCAVDVAAASVCLANRSKSEMQCKTAVDNMKQCLGFCVTTLVGALLKLGGSDLLLTNNGVPVQQ
jgi:hypothetical protein